MYILGHWKWKFDNASICVQFGVTFIMFFDIYFKFFLSLIRGVFHDCASSESKQYTNKADNS